MLENVFKGGTVNLESIARKAKVSIATVSRVINRSAAVDPEKVERVRRVLENNDYLPNTIARSLASKVTKTVGIMTPDIRHHNCSPIAYSVERTLQRHGYNSVLCNTGEEPDAQTEYLKALASRKADGIILIGFSYGRPEFSDAIRRYFGKTPVVMLNSNLDLPNVINVFGGSDEGMRVAAEHLLSLGHRRIVFVKDAGSWLQDVKEEVLRKLLRRHGAKLPDSLIYTMAHDDRAEDLVARLEREAGEYTAVIANNDLVACGIVKHLRSYGKKVPDDVSVVGYHNLEYSEYIVPALTTVDNHMERVGTVMAEALLDRLAGRAVEPLIRTSVELVVRDSTRRIG